MCSVSDSTGRLLQWAQGEVELTVITPKLHHSRIICPGSLHQQCTHIRAPLSSHYLPDSHIFCMPDLLTSCHLLACPRILAFGCRSRYKYCQWQVEDWPTSISDL